MSSGAEQNARYKLCRDLPAEKGPIFEEWLKELLDAAEGEGDEDASCPLARRSATGKLSVSWKMHFLFDSSSGRSEAIFAGGRSRTRPSDQDAD